MNKHKTIGLDLAKRVFQVCVVDTWTSHVQVNKELKRHQVLDFMRRQPPYRVFMEACGGSHYWARQLQALGHTVALISPQFVTPFRKGHKTDANDALAIVEAGLRPICALSRSKASSSRIFRACTAFGKGTSINAPS